MPAAGCGMSAARLKLVIWERTQRALESGEHLLGHFSPSNAELETPGVLRCSAARGAVVDLIGRSDGWPSEFGGAPFTVHGVASDGSGFSLLDTWVKTVSIGQETSRVSSSMLALGEQIDRDALWPYASYGTANLSEWRADTGLEVSRPNLRRRPHHLRLDWQPPTRDEVALPDAKIVFGGSMESSGVAFAPDWSIRTWQTVGVTPTEPLTIDAAHRLYAQPLLALTTFASDRPDSLTHEVLFDPDTKRRITVLRQGPVVRPRGLASNRGLSLAGRRPHRLRRADQPLVVAEPRGLAVTGPVR